MPKLLCAVLFSLLHAGALAFPAPQNDPREVAASFEWQVYKKCSEKEKFEIYRAWGESKRFADALSSWKPNEGYQPAMNMYMGDRSTFHDINYNFPQQIQDVARRRRGLHDGKSEYGTARLWVYCNEDSIWFKGCKTSDTGVVLAYEEEDKFFNNWYITFCPAFYDRNFTTPLNEIFTDMKDGRLSPMILNDWDQSTGSIFFHETMHMSQLVTSPQAKDKGYGPKAAYELARDKNTDYAYYNADSWTMVATAILAQQEMNLKDPPLPTEYAPKDQVGGKKTTGRLQTVLEQVSGFIPEGAGDKPTGPFFVDPDIWEVYGGEQLPVPVPDPKPFKGLRIIGEYVPGSKPFDWLFFSAEEGKGADCRTDMATPPKAVPWSTSGTTYPEGTWDLDLDGLKCQYTSGNSPGKVVCGDQTIECRDDEADKKPNKGEYKCGDKRRQPVFTCGR